MKTRSGGISSYPSRKRLLPHRSQFSRPRSSRGSAMPSLGLSSDQLGRLLIAVVVDPAELLGEDQDPAVGVDDLGLEVGVFQVGAVR